jgi:alkanesulfonate monooxygenase SsuD/methylene tetrahydromethanopterin reductase-like flavin-dependent oxidoreductase (luciferase family)
MHAWGIPVPTASERIEGLQETIQLLQSVWKGEPVTFEGKHVQVHDGLCVPVPPKAPRVVVGVGSSRTLLRSAVAYADELNVYANEDLIREARKEIAASGREIVLSTFVWEWRDDIEEKLKEWQQLGVERTFVTFWEPFERLESAVNWMR